MKQIPQPRMMLMAAVIAASVVILETLAFSQGLKGGPHQSPPAPVPQTGQTTSFVVGDDGDLQAGVPWPTPRFTDRGDGTVRDNLTGLIWLKNANCFGLVTWAQALTAANTLASGSCGLTDKSVAGDWHVPNIRELHSLLDFEFFFPALSNVNGTGRWTEGNAFSGVQGVRPSSYWSSTMYGNIPGDAWVVYLVDGFTTADPTYFTNFVWPVRGGK